MVAVREVAGRDLQRVKRFYLQAEYLLPLEPTDRILVAETNGMIVGALRLCSEQGLLVLRGMRVREGMRRQGIGAALLLEVDRSLGASPCFCIPHSHLELFYEKAGFRRVPDGSGPQFLQQRCLQYRQRGLDVILMERPAGAPETGRGS